MLRESHQAAMALAWKMSAASPYGNARVDEGAEEEVGAQAIRSTDVEMPKDSDLPFFYFPTLRLFLGLPR